MKLPRAITAAPIIFLTGAGASVPLGRFATREFLDYFLGEPLRAVQSGDKNAIRDFAVGLAAAKASQTIDIEDVLTTLERNATESRRFLADRTFLKRVAGGNSRAIEQYALWNEALRDAIYTTVIEHFSLIDAGAAAKLYQPLLSEFAMWFASIPGIGRTIPLFTLNYDTALEAASSKLGVRLVDGLTDTQGATERRWSHAAFEQYQEDSERAAVILVKLHGSVRWGRHSGSGDDPQATIVELPVGVGRDPGAYRHVVIYPSLAPKPTYQEPFRTGYRMFRECMNHASVLFAIGCSLRDQEIQAAISDGMDDNRKLHLVIIGPDADHSDAARRLSIDHSRVAAVRKKFEVPPPSTKGYNFLMGGLRGFAMKATGSEDARPYTFGATHAEWPGSPPRLR